VGTVLEVRTERIRVLDAHTLIGRGPHCAIRIQDDTVSNDHAVLQWAQSQWQLRDLGSTNGTWLDGERMPEKRVVTVRPGARIAFGNQDAVWRLLDEHPPEPMVTPLNGGSPCLLIDGVIAIPSPERATANICCGREGNWMLEADDTVTPIASGEVFVLSGCSWRFSCPVQWRPTSPLQSVRVLAESTFCFDVSRDEESVSLSVDCGGELVTLGRASGFYFLLTLARLRSQDMGRRPMAEAGWAHRDELVRMLRCDPGLLNVWICRIRSKLAEVGFIDYASVVERVDGSGKMRIGVANSVIRREASLSPG
jgi:hypothetical protein